MLAIFIAPAPTVTLALALLAAGADPPKSEPSSSPKATRRTALVDVTELHPRILLDIRYATADNFFGKKVYDVARCLVRPSVGEKLLKAQRWLDAQHPDLRLLFKDCYRPHHVQKVLWEAVRGTDKSRYVANPFGKIGSLHSYGAAVDVTLADADGHELDMGTPYDFLGALAEPRHEPRLLAQGKLTSAQLARRRVLRRAMREA